MSLLMNFEDFDFSKIQDIGIDADTGAHPRPAAIGRAKVTTLRCTRGVATKRFTLAGVQEYSIGKFFHAEVVPVNDIYDLGSLIQNLSGRTDTFIVRGELIGQPKGTIVRRCKGVDATLKAPDGGCRWVCFDVDSGGLLTADADTSVRNFVDGVPHLKDCTYIYQLSSSWGIKPGVRAHIWFFLAEPRTDAQIIEWASSFPVRVDMSLYNPVQPHYVSNPIFEGVADPIPGIPRVNIVQRRDTELYIPTGDVEGEIAHWEERILNLDSGEARHPLVNRAAYSLGGWVGAGLCDESELYERLMTACAQSEAFDHGRMESIGEEIRRAISDGARHPRQLCAWKQGLKTSDKGVILAIPFNFIQIFRSHPSLKECFAFDVRNQTPVILKPVPWDREGEFPRDIRDDDDTAAAAWLNSIGVISAGVDKVLRTIDVVSREHPMDAVADYLDALPPWDGVPRLLGWLPRATGCQDTPYHREIGARFLLSMVARTRDPGCKVDHMLVLIGKQGTKKSTLLSTLVGAVPGAFTDQLGDITNPANYVPTLMGPWLIEEAELSVINRREIEAVKKFVTSAFDRHRLSYGRRAVKVYRRCVFAATTNLEDPFQDQTGARRFWPVVTKDIDCEWVKSARDQLFAEALVWYIRGEKWYLEGDAAVEALERQEDHTQVDPWEEDILRFLNGETRMEYIDFSKIEQSMRRSTTINEILTALGKPAALCGGQETRRVGTILRKHGWRRTKKRVGTVTINLWERGQ